MAAVALALALGWGIRGNYGHEVGAMVPGALAAIAAAVVSGRQDWRARVPFAAFFGALGWGFGGSISYMQVIGYTHSGHLPSQLWGFSGLFVIGFLWAALGGGATALALSLDRTRLQGLFPALVVSFAALSLPPLVLAAVRDPSATGDAMRRQDSPLYWLDSDWLDAAGVALAMLAMHVVVRRGAGLPRLVLRAALGAAGGALLQAILHAAGLEGPLWSLLVRTQGDPAVFPPEALVTNWPNGLPAIARHLGWIAGLAAGLVGGLLAGGGLKGGVRLCLWLALGWLGGFLLLPVLLGVRMTPPRGDDWAGVLGVVVAALLWCRAERLPAVAAAILVAGTIGGLAFSGGVLVKLLMVAPGNPALVPDPTTLAAWSHWQAANWHSFLEQVYGLSNGVGVAVALGLLDSRLPAADDRPRWRWTELVCVLLVVPWLLHANLVDNVADWTAPRDGRPALPDPMRAPLLGFALSARGWFDLFFGAGAAGFAFLAWIQLRRPVALVPRDWLGRGQLLLMLVLWPMALGNVAKALPGFTEQRLLTEGTILLSAVALTVLVLLAPPGDRREAPLGADGRDAAGLARRAAVWLVAAAILAPVAETAVVRAVYGAAAAGHAGTNLRFGPDANWRTRPVLRGAVHR
jgi:hypothetical protein